ncbi:MAG: hypothetical protein O3A10_06880 [Chloroflexi bacterium]|nr:hypothetical protein [Chloroflexota bacterium]MDA1147021.1 hypothetical protein [Chloroflexota bacterium]
MRITIRRLALFVGAMSVVLLVGCSGSSDDAATGTASPAAATITPSVSVTVGPSAAATPMPLVTPSGVVVPGSGEQGVTAVVVADRLDVFVSPSHESYRIGALGRGDTITVSHRWAPAPLWLALPGVGWVIPSEGGLQLERPLVSIPQSDDWVAGPDQPVGAETGIPEIDATIKAVWAADADAVDALLVFQSQTCAVAPDGPGQATCPEGVPDGAVIDVFVRGVYDSDSSPIARVAGERTVDQFVDLDPANPPRLYAVVARREVTIADSEFPVLYTAFFSRPGGSFGLMLDDRGRIVAALTAGPRVGDLFSLDVSEGAEIVLAPVVPEGLSPPR